MDPCLSRTLLNELLLKKSFHIIKDFLQLDAKMLYYVKINDFEGLDHSEGQGCTRDTKFESGQCGSCLFYFYCKLNFHYERYIYNGCYHCLQYDKMNNRLLFRVITTKKELLELFTGGPLSW